MGTTERPEPRLGLALGGGAVLGFAHVGVLMELERARIRPAAVTGTSAGAIVAALLAFGSSPERMRDLVAPLTWRKVSNFSASSLGLVSNEALAELLRDELGDVRIEDAPVPLAIIAADIHTGDPVVFRDGPLAEAVRASAAIPGIYTPVQIGDRLLVDGGIVENVPVRPLKQMGVDVIVAATLGEVLDFQPVRTLLGVLTNAFLTAVNTATRLDLMEGVDVVIAPDLVVHNRWDMRQREEIIEKGRAAAAAAIPDILAALDRVSAAKAGSTPPTRPPGHA